MKKISTTIGYYKKEEKVLYIQELVYKNPNVFVEDIRIALEFNNVKELHIKDCIVGNKEETTYPNLNRYGSGCPMMIVDKKDNTTKWISQLSCVLQDSTTIKNISIYDIFYMKHVTESESYDVETGCDYEETLDGCNFYSHPIYETRTRIVSNNLYCIKYDNTDIILKLSTNCSHKQLAITDNSSTQLKTNRSFKLTNYLYKFIQMNRISLSFLKMLKKEQIDKLLQREYLFELIQADVLTPQQAVILRREQAVMMQKRPIKEILVKKIVGIDCLVKMYSKYFQFMNNKLCKLLVRGAISIKQIEHFTPGGLKLLSRCVLEKPALTLEKLYISGDKSSCYDSVFNIVINDTSYACNTLAKKEFGSYYKNGITDNSKDTTVKFRIPLLFFENRQAAQKGCGFRIDKIKTEKDFEKLSRFIDHANFKGKISLNISFIPKLQLSFDPTLKV